MSNLGSDVASRENEDPRCQCYKTYYVRNLRIFIISKGVYPWYALPALSNVCG
jgi:hypothetical protein